MKPLHGLLGLSLLAVVSAQLPIPPRYDGFLYPQSSTGRAEVNIDAFLDLLCPDSRDQWQPLRDTADRYGPEKLQLLVHPFSNAFHHNSYFAARGMHVVASKNESLAIRWMDIVFAKLDSFSNKATALRTAADVVAHFALLAESLGISKEEFLSGFTDGSTDLAARISFKYGCSRGVTQTPFFLANGVALFPDNWSSDQWAKLVDGLLSGQPQYPPLGAELESVV